MREILFRGKRIDNGKWEYGVPASEVSGDTHMITGIEECYEYACQRAVNELIDPSTVGQYTGLTDKNGVKIFEGDVVTFEDAVADFEGYHDDVFLNQGEVMYTERGMCLYFTNRQVVVMDDLFYKGTADCEVIGNIHDNPKLAGEEGKP